MCNLYDVGPAHDSAKASWEKVLQGALAGIAKLWNIRKTDPGIIVRLEDGAPKAEIARWGFKRGEFNAINNARGEKLDHYWGQHWKEGRRCLIPATAFYEWTGSHSHKRTHAILPAEPDTRLWMAGLWEQHADLGLCFTTLTTSANAFMKPIHDERMPAILHADDLENYLRRNVPMDLVKPFEGRLKSMICENPLRKGFPPAPPHPIAQVELF